MIDSWEEAQSKSKYHFFVVPVLLFVAAGGAFIFYKNNVSDSAEQHSFPINSIDTIAESSVDNDTNNVSVKKNEQIALEDLNAKIASSVSITNVRCGLGDKKSSEILISLRLYYNDKNDEDKILFKRDEIKFTVQKIMMKKKLEDINVDNLRKELKNEIDNLLGSVNLDDLEFTDFKPVELL